MDTLASDELRRLLDESYLATFCTTHPNDTIGAVPELKARSSWIFGKYVDEAGVRQRIDPIPEGAARIVEIKADKLLSWHP